MVDIHRLLSELHDNLKYYEEEYEVADRFKDGNLDADKQMNDIKFKYNSCQFMITMLERLEGTAYDDSNDRLEQL